jgi:CSLREA domain-containing protein
MVLHKGVCARYLCFTLTLAVVLITFATARAATITVTTLSDPTGPSGTCSLRDAITAANTKQATNGCAAGSGNDTINFSLTGTIRLASTLPEVTDALLEIDGPGFPDITIDGGGKVRVMEVAMGAELKLKKLAIVGGFITGNSGGGILNQGTLIVRNTTFSRNSAGNFYPAGAISSRTPGGLFPTVLTVINSTFCGNSAGSDGGAIEIDGILTVRNSNFFDNSTLSSGGGIIGGPLMTVTNSTFSGNSAGSGGGAILSLGGIVTNSTFSENTAFANANGGGIFNGNAPLTVTNSTFSGNIAHGAGGGIFSLSAPLTVTNSTFSGNSALNQSVGGGGIISSGASPTTVKSTILAGNSGGNCGKIAGGHFADAGYNISDDSTCGFAKTGSANNGDGVDPLLSPAGLAQNGGLTETIALLAGSPAIDAIPLADCTDQSTPPKRIATDQRGFPRPDAGEQFCDIGAYEYQN